MTDWDKELAKIDKQLASISDDELLKSLADEGQLPVSKVAEAISRYGIDTDKVNPLYA